MYELDTFYQNYFSYSQSRSYAQLHGDSQTYLQLRTDCGSTNYLNASAPYNNLTYVGFVSQSVVYSSSAAVITRSRGRGCRGGGLSLVSPPYHPAGRQIDRQTGKPARRPADIPAGYNNERRMRDVTAVCALRHVHFGCCSLACSQSIHSALLLHITGTHHAGWSPTRCSTTTLRWCSPRTW
jgi:hypothetical protein